MWEGWLGKLIKGKDLICKKQTNKQKNKQKNKQQNSSFQDRASNLEFALSYILSPVILLLIRNGIHNSKLFLLMLNDRLLQYFK